MSIRVTPYCDWDHPGDHQALAQRSMAVEARDLLKTGVIVSRNSFSQSSLRCIATG